MTRNRTRKSGEIKIHRIILIVLILYFIYTYISQNNLSRRLNVKKNKYEEEIQVLENDIDLLNREISNSDSLDFIEKVAREELGMVKPREIIVVDKNKQVHSED